MKKLLMPVLAIVLLASCGKDEENACTQDQFVGSYEGTRDCLGLSNEDYETSFVAGPGSNEILWTLDGEEYTLEIDDCTAKFDNKVFGIGTEIRFTLNDDGTITGSYDVLGFGCDLSLSPK